MKRRQLDQLERGQPCPLCDCRNKRGSSGNRVGNPEGSWAEHAARCGSRGPIRQRIVSPAAHSVSRLFHSARSCFTSFHPALPRAGWIFVMLHRLAAAAPVCIGQRSPPDGPARSRVAGARSCIHRIGRHRDLDSAPCLVSRCGCDSHESHQFSQFLTGRENRISGDTLFVSTTSDSRPGRFSHSHA